MNNVASVAGILNGFGNKREFSQSICHFCFVKFLKILPFFIVLCYNVDKYTHKEITICSEWQKCTT